MPYIPSKKTDGKSTDRERIDEVVESYALMLCKCITNSNEITPALAGSFIGVGRWFLARQTIQNPETLWFATCIEDVGQKYKYDGAFLGALNYGITRAIQRVPQILAEQGKCGLQKGKEFRYWLYAKIVSALIKTSIELSNMDIMGVSGVFEDIKDEYKARVNKSYEIEQILKSGDCYDTPYFNKVVEVVDEDGKNVGYTYIELKNDGTNVLLDKMPYKLVVKS